MSDARTKGDWHLFEEALAKICNLTLVGTFARMHGPGNVDPSSTRHVGLAAQEVEKVLPEAVSAVDDGLLTIRYQDVFVMNIKATQELARQNRELKARVDHLEASNAQLMARMERMEELVARS